MEPDLSTLEPVYHYSACPETELAWDCVRVKFRVELGKAIPVSSVGSKSVSMDWSVFTRLQNVIRCTGALSFDVDCICKPDLQGNLVAIKYNANSFGTYKKHKAIRLPRLKLPAERGQRVTRQSRTQEARPQYIMTTEDGRIAQLSASLVRVQCLIKMHPPTSSTETFIPRIDIVDGLLKGKPIDVTNKVAGLERYIPSVLKYAAERRYWPIIAKIDCSAIVGHDRWIVQKWAYPEEIETMALSV